METQLVKKLRDTAALRTKEHDNPFEARTQTVEWEAAAHLQSLILENWQLKVALGYPVPGEILAGDFKCGMCNARQTTDHHQLELASPIDEAGLREPLCVILEWYEQLPNDELPPHGVRRAFGKINEALGVPEK